MNIQVLNIKVLVNAGKRTRKLFFLEKARNNHILNMILNRASELAK